MKLNSGLNIALIVATGLTIGSGGYYLYSNNALGVRQHVAESQRQANFTPPDQKLISRSRVQDDVIHNDYSSRHWGRLGTVVVPKLGISLPIYNQPYDKDALQIGAQQLNATDQGHEISSAPGSGNFLLVAHNYNDGKTMFSALQQTINQNTPYLVNGKTGTDAWLNGQSIYLASQAGVFQYEIDGQKAVSAKEINVRQNTAQPELNIITCLYPDDHYRIVTHAQQKQFWSWQQVPAAVLSNFDLGSHPYNLPS